jgi:hypothetical protein
MYQNALVPGRLQGTENWRYFHEVGAGTRNNQNFQMIGWHYAG